MEPTPHLPDMCFIANAGLVLDNVFVPSVFRVPQRVPEVPHFRRWFKEQNFAVENLNSESNFEGEGDALFHPRSHDTPLLWAGYGVRSGLLSHQRLTEIFRCEVVSLRLVDQRFYHLDTCLAPLPDGGLIIDTPGMRELQIWSDSSSLQQNFEDITELALQCRFSDCQHDTEPGCAVGKAISNGEIEAERLERYRKLERELAHLDSQLDAAGRAEKKQDRRRLSKSIRNQPDKRDSE